MLKGLVDGPGRAEAQLLQRDAQRGRAAQPERAQRVGRPLGHLLRRRVGRLGFERGYNLLDAARAEAAVDGGPDGAGRVERLVVREPRGEFFDGGVDDGVSVVEGGVVAEGELCEAGFEVGEGGRVEVVRRYARVARTAFASARGSPSRPLDGEQDVQSIHPIQALARQCQIRPHLPIQPRQEETRAHVGKEADLGLGHGELGPLGRDAKWRVHAQSRPAAHGDAVHEGDVRLRVGRDQVVKLVFKREEVARLVSTFLALLAEPHDGCDVAAGAEGLVAPAFDDYDIGQLGFLPFLRWRGSLGPSDTQAGKPTHLQSWDDLPRHAPVQRVELLGPIELDCADAVQAVEEHVVRFVFGQLSWYRDLGGHLRRRKLVVRGLLDMLDPYLCLR